MQAPSTRAGLPVALCSAVWPKLSRRLARAPWVAALAGLYLGVIGLTWQRWTPAAFPLDAGRELIMASLLLEGKSLYSDVRCFYGPVGYWLNTGAAAVLGTGPEALWRVNLVRYVATLAVLWMLARRLLNGPLAALALASSVYALFYSLMVPYSASVGWGLLFIAAGVEAYARQLSRPWGGGRADESLGDIRNAAAGSVLASAVLLALAAGTKHEYAFAAALLLPLFAFDRLARCPDRRSRLQAAALILLGGGVPLVLMSLIVLRSAPLGVVIRENLWVPALLEHFGGAMAYGPLAGVSGWKLLMLAEWAGLLLMAVGAVSGWSASRRSPGYARAVSGGACAEIIDENGRHGGRPLHRAGCSGSTAGAWCLLAAGFLLVAAAEISLRGGAWRSGLPLDYPKPRWRNLLDTLPLACVPLLILLAIDGCNRIRRSGLRLAWLRLGLRGRLGALCVVGYLAGAVRQIPSGIELIRQPFTPIILAWMLAIWLPRRMRWARPVRCGWSVGVAALLFMTAVCGLDSIVHLQRRPSTVVQGSCGEMFAWQRRMPYRPAWFHDAVNTVSARRADIERGGIACVPEGAWVHVLLGLKWPTRDTQWMPFCQSWIVEDLASAPPEFLLVMEPDEIRLHLPRVQEVLRRQYVPIETNASGMVLYQLGVRPEAPRGPRPDAGAGRGESQAVDSGSAGRPAIEETHG